MEIILSLFSHINCDLSRWNNEFSKIFISFVENYYDFFVRVKTKKKRGTQKRAAQTSTIITKKIWRSNSIKSNIFFHLKTQKILNTLSNFLYLNNLTTRQPQNISWNEIFCKFKFFFFFINKILQKHTEWRVNKE